MLLLRRGVDLLDFLPRVDLVANRLEARGQLGDGEGDGGTAGQVETQLLELVLRHLLADAKALTDAHGLRDRFFALPHDGELALEETAVLGPACVLQVPSGLVRGAGQRGALGVAGLLREVGLARGQIRRERDDAVHLGQQGRDVRSSRSAMRARTRAASWAIGDGTSAAPAGGASCRGAGTGRAGTMTGGPTSARGRRRSAEQRWRSPQRLDREHGPPDPQPEGKLSLAEVHHGRDDDECAEVAPHGAQRTPARRFPGIAGVRHLSAEDAALEQGLPPFLVVQPDELDAGQLAAANLAGELLLVEDPDLPAPGVRSETDIGLDVVDGQAAGARPWTPVRR